MASDHSKIDAQQVKALRDLAVAGSLLQPFEQVGELIQAAASGASAGLPRLLRERVETLAAGLLELVPLADDLRARCEDILGELRGLADELDRSGWSGLAEARVRERRRHAAMRERRTRRGDRLVRFRVAAGLSAPKAAETAGVTVTTLRRWEAGWLPDELRDSGQFKLHRLIRLLSAYGRDLEDLEAQELRPAFRH